MGFGAFLAFYLANLDWSKQDVGLVLMVGGLAGVAAQLPGKMEARAHCRWRTYGGVVRLDPMGALAIYLSSSVIFIAAAILCIPTLLAVYQIRPHEIDYARARNAAKRDHTFDVQRVMDLGKNRKLLVFAVCMVLFHFGNASLLPLVGQNVGHSKAALSPLLMAGLIIVPQVVVALLAPWIGYWSELFGRKPLLLVGFAIEATRALLFTLTSDPWL